MDNIKKGFLRNSVILRVLVMGLKIMAKNYGNLNF
jgi:hypothetical protein